MYIKGIKVQGFKSFADKLELDFNTGITAIVGPNGSGKSNVVDAILWVLGEQSLKTLRGESQMTDVIFSGSKTREEAKKASVAITFDNSDQRLNTEFKEVEIKRVIFQTGENEYYINNVKVRHKDIIDILMDVTSKFNIITQGNINALVENKSSERRTLFESAAGVLKYKKRKDETLKKLDSTKENITRINLIIKELNTTLKPLEKQKNDAEKYVKIKSELEDLDIALMAYDINIYTNKYNELIASNKSLEEELVAHTFPSSAILENKKTENLKLTDYLGTLNQELIKVNQELAELNSQKQINIERSKFGADKDAINLNLVSLNEESLSLERKIESTNKEIGSLKELLKNDILEYNKASDSELKSKIKITNYNNTINTLNKDIMLLQNKINIEKSNMENNAFLPKSVNSVLNNPRLSGIHNTIGNLIDTDETYKIGIDIALGASANFIVVDNMNSAKSAINYLKENHLGRATFFPIDTIKSRYVSKDVLDEIRNLDGFIGVASDLTKCDKKYSNIIENQLGQVLVVSNMDAMFTISKSLDYKYKMVTLDGEVIYPGGSLSGGTDSKNTFNKGNLNSLLKDLETKENLLSTNSKSLKLEDDNHVELIDSVNKYSKKVSETKFAIENLNNSLIELETKLKDVKQNIDGMNALNDSDISDKISLLLKEISEKEKKRDIIESDIALSKSKQFEISNEIISLEKETNEKNQAYHKIENDIKTNQVEIGKLEVHIDTLLQNLSDEYSISYENANNNYTLNLDPDLAREKVTSLKNSIKGLNNINVGSISEYDRLKKRYDFLDGQRNDLESSSADLLKIIEDMDNIVKDKFKTTFGKIASEFSNIFRQMFKGGNGLLKLTDENDLLNTGISILAVPPGKKLNSTAALSGGEKALTAICLIFAILKVNPTPFIVLDEVEAPLDEENVNMFGEYLKQMKNENQFILITHKKRMMEYADILYGITMQESGVSKLVSVKLDD